MTRRRSPGRGLRARARRRALAPRRSAAARASPSRSIGSPARSTAGRRAPADRARGPVLDVGCGPGRHVHHLARRGVLAIGIDVSRDAVRLARRRGASVILRFGVRRRPRRRAAGAPRCCSTATSASAATRPGSCAASRPAGARRPRSSSSAPRHRRAASARTRSAGRAGHGQRAVPVGARRPPPSCSSIAAARGPGRDRSLDGRGAALRCAGGPMRLLPEPTAARARRGPSFWRSPLRGPWLTVALGSLLFPVVLLVAATGFLSHAAYNPDLGHNAIVPRGRDFQLVRLRLAHQSRVALRGHPGLPRHRRASRRSRCCWPSCGRSSRACSAGRRSATSATRSSGSSLLGLVGGALFEFATGVVNAQLYYPFRFNFVVAHYYGAWVFTLCLLLHVGVKLPIIRRAYRERGVLAPLLSVAGEDRPRAVRARRPGRAAARPRRRSAGAGCSAWSAPPAPRCSSPPPASRSAGRCAGSRCSRRAARRRRSQRLRGQQDRRRRRGMTEETVARLAPAAARRSPRGAVARAAAGDGAARPATCPIACVEGWSTTQRWTGVRLRDLAALAGVPDARPVDVVSLQPQGVLRQATLSARPDRRRALAAGAAGQRRRPVARPRLPGADHRPGAARRAQHQVGRVAGVPRVIGRLRAAYGEGPLHLLGHLAVLAGAGYAVVQLADARGAVNIFVWLIGAALLHDLVFLPAYASPTGPLGACCRIRRVPRRQPRPLRRGGLRRAAARLVPADPRPGTRQLRARRPAASRPTTSAAGWSITAGADRASQPLAYGVRLLRAGRVEQLDDAVGAARRRRRARCVSRRRRRWAGGRSGSARAT